ncbi:MAG: ATP-binding protein [Microscillaceae bacterium]|nr:ATP-binding protein [Microscillaceae bacterium]MDW8461904.1 ATP-binding protein [Cytophagales bacterium]
MDLQELKKLVRKGEGQTLEFKLKANHPEKLVREMVAFANSNGGVLLVGIHDDKRIEGVSNPDEDEYLIEKAIQKHTFPPLPYHLERLPIDSKTTEREVLIYHIPKSTQGYYSFVEYKPKKNFRAYIRLADKSVQASKEMKEVLKGKAKNKNIRFRFGEKERILMQYLADNKRISVKQFAELANIPYRVASRTLVLLVLAKVLSIVPHLKEEDTFELRQDEESSKISSQFIK